MAKILLVDDDPDSCDFISRLLSNHEIIIAGNAAEAVSLALSHAPQLILMDMLMPDRPGGTVSKEAGLEATRKIRASAGLAEVPIFALTGHTMLHFKESVLAAGCCEFVAKPVKFKALLELIGRYIKD